MRHLPHAHHRESRLRAGRWSPCRTVASQLGACGNHRLAHGCTRGANRQKDRDQTREVITRFNHVLRSERLLCLHVLERKDRKQTE